MRPVLFRHRWVKIYSYPAMLYLGLLFGVAAGNYATHVVALDGARIFIATLLLLIPALVGARLLFVVSHWSFYRHNRERIWERSEGGGALYGGLPLSLLVSVPLLNICQVPFGAFWDIATFTILVGMIFVRVGCLLNGCCGGRPSSGRFALYLPDYQGYWQQRIPTQLLEAGLALLLLIAAALLWRYMPFHGALFLSAMLSYGLGRFLLEFIRDKQECIGRFTLNHAISATLVVCSLITFWAASFK